MIRLLRLIMTAGLSAAAMYLFDAKEGSKRRNMLREQAGKLMKDNNLQNMDWQKVRDQVTDRARGVVKEIEGMVKNEAVDDETLVARVRSQMGHLVSNASAINVTANNGTVTLTGPINKTEEARLMTTLAMIPGVMHIENGMSAYNTPENMPSMQETDIDTPLN